MNKICFYCKKEILPEEESYFYGVDRPYINLRFHREHYKLIENEMLTYLQEHEEDLLKELDKMEKEVDDILEARELIISDKRKASIRNLAQYRNMDDDEFEDFWAKKMLSMEPSAEFEKRIQIKLKMFEKDYDLSDMKFNDTETLRAMVQAMIALEDYEQEMFKSRALPVDDNSLSKIEKLNRIMNGLRADIGSFQDVLKISRKIRKSDKDISLISLLETMKEKAAKFYQSRMSYIFCPNCQTLIGTVWTLYPETKANKIKLICKHDLGEGELCNTEILIGTLEMMENRGVNIKNIAPESIV